MSLWRMTVMFAMIIGATRGFGLAVAKTYVAELAMVANFGLDPGQAKKATVELGNDAIAVKFDVTQKDNIEAAAMRALHLISEA
ncbi:SDR family NAD(P)-dependent oxidoreductase [Agrobacterium rhizogenes]|uniref:Oxidoreductase n=1 Tax=Rhizobium rhizogenes NBRC 13257 TaxID=1220581 RepID=A0AA87U8L2_RHIRH|nr:SDR family NAD(P)-dependent oxidoreductase [Rhizobium rhizogenes]NTG65094.1 SDR family NAD(P)-dependent oxidoreductase [Rhizobium rhizogenes]NTG71545.1 SDR family NAD(P)-dependent oxidoreductase [Rhizobium rhizogenes]NTG84444.1 SDR family NAD(P)-dependent oxidoreductase [Rhizobium rhizogenes]NTG90838.1 SDR family NAD(P)-dependent oxidoreductase [Rhizobium rhizogenes]NTH29472.1 SDR family NAD(P)-dependent oxidoreductase [Rhizobium rhizogenes]